jgi:hypothetical protein
MTAVYQAARERVLFEPDQPLMVARGYASLSFLHSAAEYINGLDVPAYIYHLADFDPSGVNAGLQDRVGSPSSAPPH